MTNSEEVELKFACAPDDLAAVLAAAPPGDEDEAELISVYFDTAGKALQKAGASLRVRESHGRRVQTIKRGRGLAREEHETPIEGLAPDPALGPLPDLVPPGERLAPAFNVRVSRRQRRLSYAGAQIELALDQGEVVGGDARSPICEVELELKAGDRKALFALARKLAEAAPIYLSFASKAARGQALVAGAADAAPHSEAVALSGAETVGEAFQATAREALAQIAGNAALLREKSSAEAVHQLRVGARRLRSAVSTFGRALADDRLDAVKAELKWLGHACDRARNLDVYAEAAGASDPDAPAAGLEVLHKTLSTARRRARQDTAQALASRRFRLLMIDVLAWTETGDWLCGPAAAAPAKPFAAKALARRRRRVLELGQRLDEADNAALHKLRIAAKKLRYAGDAFAALFPQKRVRAFTERVKILQTELGELNDLATASPLLESLALAPEAALAAGEMLGKRLAERPRRIRRAGRAFERLATALPYWR
jgi:inorganic triphosphatase YgiF